MSPSSSSVVGSDRAQIDALTQQLQVSESKLAYAECRIQLLEEALRAQRIKKYGPKSDRLTSAQLELLEAEPGVGSEEVEQEAERPPLETIAQANRKKRKPHPGRKTLPTELSRVEHVIVCTPEQCV